MDETKFLQTIPHILNQVKHDWQVYKNEQAYVNVYQKWLYCPHSFTLQEENLLEFRQKDLRLPNTKPSHLLIVDNTQGTNLYSNKE